VTSEFGRTLTRIDARTGKVTDTTRIGNRPGAIAATPAGVWVSVASAGVEHRGGTLRIVGGPPDTVDPGYAYDADSWALLSITNDGLVAFRHVGGSDGAQLVPDLATAIPAPSEGGRTYTFQLRRGIAYSSGQGVRAADVRRSIERLYQIGSPATDQRFFDRVVGADACARRPKSCDLSRGIVTSDAARTVTFHLTAPDPTLLYKLAMPFAYPLPAGVPDRPSKRPLPATGPYRITDFEPLRLARLARNPRFRPWAGAAQPGGYPDEIEWRAKGDAAALTAVEQGDSDLASPSPSRVEKLSKEYAGRLHVNPDRATWYLFLNTKVRPFTSLAARRALNYAIDRRHVAALFGGTEAARPTCQLLPPNFPGYRRHCPYRLDRLRAKRLVAFSRTRGERVTIVTTNDSRAAEWRAVARYTASVLRRIGYRTAVKVLPGGLDNYFTAIYARRSRAQLGLEGWFPDYPSPFGFIESNVGCGALGESNASRFCDPALERQVRRATNLESTEPAAAVELWARIDRRLTDLAPYVSLFNGTNVHFVSSRVGNYQYNPQWAVLLDQLWVK
jgi:peptide/nickel transport system substrate-binding protein